MEIELSKHGYMFCEYWCRSLSLHFSPLHNWQINIFQDWKGPGAIRLLSSLSSASFKFLSLSSRSFLKVINKPSLILPGRALTLLLCQPITFFKLLSHCPYHIALEYRPTCFAQEAVKYVRTRIVSYSGCTPSVRK